MDWSGLLMPLRYASIAYSNQTYEEVACVVSGSVSCECSRRLRLQQSPKFTALTHLVSNAMRISLLSPSYFVAAYLKSTINLTKPPIYNVTSDCQAALGLY